MIDEDVKEILQWELFVVGHWTGKKNLEGYTSQPSPPFGKVRRCVLGVRVCTWRDREIPFCILPIPQLVGCVEINMPHVYMLAIKKVFENKSSNRQKVPVEGVLGP